MLPEAKAHYDRGLELYRARDYAAAVQALEQGFALDPRREFLFAEAQALRLAGECARAIPLYQQFIESGPQPLQAQAARLGIDRCAPERTPPAKEGAAAAGAKPGDSASPANAGAPPPAGSPPPAAAPALPPPAPAERAVWWRDPWVLSAAGAGVVALGVGATALVASGRAADQARSPQTTTYGEFDRLWSQAAERRTIAAVALAAGAGLLAAGGARALWLDRNRPEQSPVVPSLSLDLPSAGAAAAVSLSCQGFF